ncbi:yellow-e3 [Xylocopa sonorina]|uniref:yellow-e3 n=1 Tax=Xylocopa sonorina TaxID=1818115 RepID=UPI00403AAF91
MRRFYLAVLMLLLTVSLEAIEKMKTIYSWKSLEFAFPNEHAKQTAINNGAFIPGAPVPIDVDVYVEEHKSKVFVSIPRFQDGVPLTLGYVTEQVSVDGNPIIAPYPNWDYNTLGSCDSITSVYRMQIDECGRLWILDTGVLKSKRICPPQLLVFSLRENVLITRYKFPKEYLKQDSLFVTVVVDIRDVDRGCKDTFAYIADVTGFALLVYDFRHSKSWKIVNNLFYPYPPYGTFNIKGDTFDLMDGILGLALGPIRDGDRTLYFHSLASRVEARVPASVIRNHTIFNENPEAAARSFVPFEHERSSQSAAEVMDRDGVLFFGLLSELAIGCWNSKHYPEYGGKNIRTVVSDSEKLQFPSGMKIVTSKNRRQELWVLTASFQRYMSNSLHANETNFRIQAGFVHELVRGTKCDVSSLRHLHTIHRSPRPSAFFTITVTSKTTFLTTHDIFFQRTRVLFISEVNIFSKVMEVTELKKIFTYEYVYAYVKQVSIRNSVCSCFINFRFIYNKAFREQYTSLRSLLSLLRSLHVYVMPCTMEIILFVIKNVTKIGKTYITFVTCKNLQNVNHLLQLKYFCYFNHFKLSSQMEKQTGSTLFCKENIFSREEIEMILRTKTLATFQTVKSKFSIKYNYQIPLTMPRLFVSHNYQPKIFYRSKLINYYYMYRLITFCVLFLITYFVPRHAIHIKIRINMSYFNLSKFLIKISRRETIYRSSFIYSRVAPINKVFMNVTLYCHIYSLLTQRLLTLDSLNDVKNRLPVPRENKSFGLLYTYLLPIVLPVVHSVRQTTKKEKIQINILIWYKLFVSLNCIKECTWNSLELETMIRWLSIVCFTVVSRAWLIPLPPTKNLANSLNVIYEWKYFDYDFGSEDARQAAITSGEYDYKSSVAIDVDKWNDLTFVTILRDKGVPSSVNVISKKTGKGGPLLKPYPDWNWAKAGNCSGITSVYRVAIDKCDRLWILDTGYNGNDAVCPPQLLTFDLHTSKLLKRAKIPINIATDLTTRNGLLVTPVVDTRGQRCEDTVVYIADVSGYGLIVYNGQSFKRFTSRAFLPDPKAGVYTIEGQSFKLEDGILGMAFSSRSSRLYFSPMSSYDFDFVESQELRNSQNGNVNYQVYHDILLTQASAKAVSDSGAIFFGLVNSTSIGCWNEQKPLVKSNFDVVAANSKTLQFTSGLKVKRSSRDEVLWALTNRYQKVATGTMNFNEVNFRILNGKVKDLICNSRCMPI